MASFDIVCQVDFQEVTNAVDQARREIANRYDFKGSNCTIELDSQKGELLITADDEYKMQTVIDILLTREGQSWRIITAQSDGVGPWRCWCFCF